MGGVLFYPHYVTSSLRVKSQIVVISQKHPTISWIRFLQALFSAFELCMEIQVVAGRMGYQVTIFTES